MTKTERLNPIIRVSESNERAAARRLGEVRQVLSEHQERLRELERYRDEYARIFQRESGGGIDAARLQDYHRFSARLDDAIACQCGKTEEAARRLEDRKRAWLKTRTRCMSLDKAVQNFGIERRLKESRREQGESDQRAQDRSLFGSRAKG